MSDHWYGDRETFCLHTITLFCNISLYLICICHITLIWLSFVSICNFVTFRFTWYVSVILPWFDYLSSVLNFEIITFVIFQLWRGLYLAARCYSQRNVGHLWTMTWVHIWPHFLCISSLALVWHSFCWWLDPVWFRRPVPSLSCLQNAGLCVRAIFPFLVSLWSRVHFFFACRSATDFLMYIIYSYIYIHISTVYLYRELTLETSFWDVRRTSARLYIKWYFLCQITVIVYLDYLYDFSMLYSLTDCPMHPSGTLHTAMWDCLWTVFYPTCSFPYQWHAPVRLVFFFWQMKTLARYFIGSCFWLR